MSDLTAKVRALMDFAAAFDADSIEHDAECPYRTGGGDCDDCECDLVERWSAARRFRPADLEALEALEQAAAPTGGEPRVYTKAELAAMDCPLPPESIGCGLRNGAGILPGIWPDANAARLAAPDGYEPFDLFDRPDAPPPPEGEPVAYRYREPGSDSWAGFVSVEDAPDLAHAGLHLDPLYAAPPPAPLRALEVIAAAWLRTESTGNGVYIREAIEAALAGAGPDPVREALLGNDNEDGLVGDLHEAVARAIQNAKKRDETPVIENPHMAKYVSDQAERAITDVVQKFVAALAGAARDPAQEDCEHGHLASGKMGACFECMEKVRADLAAREQCASCHGNRWVWTEADMPGNPMEKRPCPACSKADHGAAREPEANNPTED